MGEQAEEVPDAPPPKNNVGWFRKGDPRINREGRPRGSKAGCEPGSGAGDRAPRTDRLMVLLMSGRELAHRISHRDAPWIKNLPADFQIVACRVDPVRAAVALVIRSKTFPRVARGAVIPEFAVAFDGLRWQLRGSGRRREAPGRVGPTTREREAMPKPPVVPARLASTDRPPNGQALSPEPRRAPASREEETPPSPPAEPVMPARCQASCQGGIHSRFCAHFVPNRTPMPCDRCGGAVWPYDPLYGGRVGCVYCQECLSERDQCRWDTGARPLQW
jgi:hypothetical protein